MPGFVFSPVQVDTMLSMAALEPVRGSPLRSARRYPRPMSEEHPDFVDLANRGCVTRHDGGWRMNSIVAGALRACAQPDEVIDIGTTDPTSPGFSVVRRGRLVAECTMSRRGSLKLFLPLTRAAVITNIVSALSSEREESAPTGFRFVGTAGEAFALATMLRVVQQGAVSCSRDRLHAAIAHDAQVPMYTLAFSATAGPDDITALVISHDLREEAIDALVRHSHLVGDDDSLAPSAQALEVLGHPGVFGFAVTHRELVDGALRSASLSATRCGPRTLVFRIRSRPGDPVEFEWVEVTRAELRQLVGALLLTERERRVLLGLEVAEPQPAPAPTPAATSAPATAPSPAPGSTPAWTPTHTVPATGTRAWPAPDPNAAVVAHLDPFLPVQVMESLGAWSRIVCSNGWSAWVDGRELQEGVA